MNNVTQTAQAKSSQYKNLIMVAVVIFILLGIFVWTLSANTQDVASNQLDEKLNFSDPLQHADPESVVLEKVQRGLTETKKETQELKKQLDEQMTEKSLSSNDKQSAIEERLIAIEKRLEATEHNSHAAEIANKYSEQGMPASYQNMTVNQATEQEMEETRLTLTPPDAAKNYPLKNPDTYVPAGTFAQAVMLSGADASTALTTPRNPTPMIFRIISNGILPNHKKSHLKGCILTAYVNGDISSERGEINLDKISCTFPNNEIIDPKVAGWIFGRDGKYGIRGNPVWREGKLLQRAFAAGALAGLSDGLSQTYTSNSILAEGNVQTVRPGKIFSYGAAKGVGKAMDKLADYNIQRAEQYHPVIQISPGDVVDVVFQDGFFLDAKKHEPDEPRSNMHNLFPQNNSAPLPQTPAAYTEEQTLPLSADQVRRIQENNKQLGFRISGDTNS